MSQFTTADHAFMSEALSLARRGLITTTPNPSVGCVLVRDGDVVGRGWHERAGGPHAEAVALAEAGERARGATAFVTLEPCTVTGRTPPCANALIEAGVARVVFAMRDPNPRVDGQGAACLREAGVAVAEGLMAGEAARLNEGFAMRMREGRPFVTVKLGASLDGRTAMRGGESQWITGAAARADAQALRARACAIMTGVGTVLADDPSLTVRDARFGTDPRQPLRVVMDSALRTPTTAKLLHLPGEVLLFGARPCEDAGPLTATGAEYRQLELQDFGVSRQGVNLAAALQALGEMAVNELLVEAGARLTGSLLAAGLVDRIVLYLAPTLLGSETRGMFDTPERLRLGDGIALSIEDTRQVGNDLRITARPEAQH